MVYQLVQQFERFRVTALSVPGRMNDSVRQHRDIIEAFRDSNAALVESLVMANAEKSGHMLVEELLKEKPKHDLN